MSQHWLAKESQTTAETVTSLTLGEITKSTDESTLVGEGKSDYRRNCYEPNALNTKRKAIKVLGQSFFGQ